MPKKITSFPQTSESAMKLPPVGLNLCSIIDMNEWEDKQGNPKKDNRGYPGISVVFSNEQKENISANFYYSDKPIDDPSRQDDNLKCKSEFLFDRLKRALGFSSSDNPDIESIKMRKLWVPVILKQIVDKEGKPLYKDGKPKEFKEVLKEFYAYNEGMAAPILAGDPIHSSSTEPGGIFLVLEKDYKASTAPSTDRAQAHATQNKPPSNDDMPVDDEVDF